MRLKRRLGDSGAAQATNPKSAGSPLPGKAITGRRTLPNNAEQCRTMPKRAAQFQLVFLHTLQLPFGNNG